MKKIYKLIVVCFIAFTSCNDAIDIAQDGELNNEALFTSVANMQQVLNDVYNRMTVFNDVLVGAQLTDEVALAQAGFIGNTHRFDIFSDNGFASGIWNQKYQAIDRANRLIAGAALFTPDPADQAEYNNIIAQARAIRAYGHLRLLQFFSTDMADDNALGVMLLDRVITVGENLPRSINADIYTFIEEDLQFAENNLTTPVSGAGSWYVFNANVIDAMRARMYLYREDHVQAEFYADRVIDNSGISLASCSFTLPTDFPLTTDDLSAVGAPGFDSFDAAPPAGIQRALWQMDRWTATTTSPTYKKMWVDAAQGEMIFSMVRPNNVRSIGSWFNTNNSASAGAPLWDMGRNLYNLFAEPLGGGAQDFRRWAFIDRSASILANADDATQGNENIIIDKYPGKNGSHTSNDYKVFRMSEMYLIKAECRVEANDLGGAANILQMIRQNRNYIAGATVPTPSFGNETEAYADILKERRKELCFEGHRYIDLKRIGSKGGVNMTDRFMKDSENSSAINPFNIAVDDFRFTLPIPQSEINVNPLEQNPGATYQ